MLVVAHYGAFNGTSGVIQTAAPIIAAARCLAVGYTRETYRYTANRFQLDHPTNVFVALSCGVRLRVLYIITYWFVGGFVAPPGSTSRVLS